MKLRILDILKEKGKTKYWLYIQLGLSYQNFNRIVNNETSGIKFENLKVSQCRPKLNSPKVVKIRAISRKLTRKVRT